MGYGAYRHVVFTSYLETRWRLLGDTRTGDGWWLLEMASKMLDSERWYSVPMFSRFRSASRTRTWERNKLSGLRGYVV